MAAGVLVASLTAMLGEPTASAQDATPAMLTPSEGAKLTRDFGEDRESRSVTLTFDANRALQSAPAVTLGDAHNAAGKLFDGSVTATAELVGGKTVRVPVVIDPADGAAAGTYMVAVHLRGPDVANADASVAAKLTRSPDETDAWVIAAVALLLGVAAGSALRWLAGSGTKLHDMLARYEVLTAALQSSGEAMPHSLLRDLGGVKLLLAQGSLAQAETELKKLEEGMPKLLGALDMLNGASAHLLRQEQQIANDPLETRFKRAIAAEHQQLVDAVNDAWPNTDSGKDTRAQLVAGIAGFSDFLNTYKDLQSRSDPKFEAALAKYEVGELKEAMDQWRPVQIAGAEAPTEQEAALPLPPRVSRPLWFAARHAPALAGILTALAVVVIGLITVFDLNKMFLENDVKDFFGLVGWGFASALTGMTFAELTAKAVRPAANP